MVTAVQHLETLRFAARSGITSFDAANVETALKEFCRIQTETGLPIDVFGLRPPDWQLLQDKIAYLLSQLSAGGATRASR